MRALFTTGKAELTTFSRLTHVRRTDNLQIELFDPDLFHDNTIDGHTFECTRSCLESPYHICPGFITDTRCAQIDSIPVFIGSRIVNRLIRIVLFGTDLIIYSRTGRSGYRNLNPVSSLYISILLNHMQFRFRIQNDVQFAVKHSRTSIGYPGQYFVITGLAYLSNHQRFPFSVSRVPLNHIVLYQMVFHTGLRLQHDHLMTFPFTQLPVPIRSNRAYVRSQTHTPGRIFGITLPRFTGSI